MKNFVIFVSSIGVTFYRAVVLSLLWFWYVVPFGLPEISTTTFFILSYMLALVTVSRGDILNARDADDDTLYMLLFLIVLSSLALFFGWILL